jgi:formate-dependent nitrite reductase membrane component NrfD
VSSAEVTREGLEGVRPGREAKTWSHGDGQGRARAPHEHPGGSYYGKPIINPPVWEELDIAGYLFAGGLAGASSILAAGADLSGRPRLARRCKLCATGALGASLTALIHDLGRPARFLNMLRVFKPTSPMNMGAWLLGIYGPLNTATAASDTLDILPAAGKAAGIGAGILGAGVATYTAALIADTAVPAWHEGRRELPFLFAGSAAAAAGGFGLIAAPSEEAAPARRTAVLGAATELVAEHMLERRLAMIAETLHDGKAGRRLKIAKALTLAGALATATPAHRVRLLRSLGGAALLAGSALTRFGLFEAGMASARDPRYTVQPQRERMDATHAQPPEPGTTADERDI